MFKEPMPSVLRKTLIGALAGAALLTWLLKSDWPWWLFGILNVFICFILTLGGHFLERAHIKYFEPKLMKHPVENAAVRIMMWILGGGILVQIALLFWKVSGVPHFEGITFWMGGVLFALFHLAVLHPIMTFLELNSFYNNRG